MSTPDTTLPVLGAARGGRASTAMLRLQARGVPLVSTIHHPITSDLRLVLESAIGAAADLKLPQARLRLVARATAIPGENAP